MKTLKSAIAALERAKSLKGKAQIKAVESVVRKLVRGLANAHGGGPDDGLLP